MMLPHVTETHRHGHDPYRPALNTQPCTTAMPRCCTCDQPLMFATGPLAYGWQHRYAADHVATPAAKYHA